MIVSESLLSSNDAHVLSALFDPESSPSSSVKVDSSLRPFPQLSDDELASLQTAERTAIHSLAVPSPSKQDIDAAIMALTSIISSQPNYASAYTNRAQTVRLAIGDDLFAPANIADIERVFNDLASAISLATPGDAGRVSPVQAKILATAHTHRAYLYLKAAKAAGDSETGFLEGGPEKLRGLRKERLEEMASGDFALGGRYGDRLAKEMAVKTNPYAKMCGAIVKEAMREEIYGGKVGTR
jgi:hypothetical protein